MRPYRSLQLPLCLRKLLPGRLTVSSVLALALSASASPALRAASTSWLAAPGTADWVTGTNWTSGSAPGALGTLTNNELATFLTSTNGNGTVAAPVVIDATRNIGSLAFGANSVTPAAFVIGTTGGNSLQLSSGGAISVISGIGGTNITETVNAPLVLEPATGATAGTYSFSNSSATASNILVIGGTVTGGTTTAGITLTLTGVNTGANEVKGNISNGGAATGLAVTKTNSGTWILSGANSYTGPTTLSQGTLSVGSSANLGDSSSNLIFNGGTLQVTGTTLTNVSGLGHTVVFNAGVTAGFDINNAANTFTLDQALNATSNLLKTGSGTLIVNQATSYSGTTTLNAGTLILTSANTSSGATTVTSGILQLNNANNGGLAGGTFTFANIALQSLLANQAISNNIVMNGTSTVSGANNIIFNGSFTDSGSRTLTNSITGGNTLTFAGSVFISEAAATDRIFTLAGASNTIISGVIANAAATGVGKGTLTITNTGLTTISNLANTYSGGTVLSNGVLAAAGVSVTNIGSTGDASSSLGAGSGALNFGATTVGGKLIYTGTGETTNRVVNLAGTTGGGLIDQSGTGLLKFTSAFTPTGIGNKVVTLQGSTAGTGELSGAITDSTGSTTGVTKTGTGTWTLSGNNSYTGATLLNQGSLILASINAINGSAISIGAGTTLTETADNAISGASSIAFGTSANTVTLDHANNFTGAITMGNNASNTLILTHTGAIASSSGATVTAGTFRFLSNAAGTTTFTTPNINFTAMTINVDNNGSGSGNTIALSGGITASITGRTLTVTGGNDYTLSIPSFTLATNASGASDTLNPQSANVIVDTIINPAGNTANTSTVVLSGATTGNKVTGVIANSTGGGITAVATTGLTGIWTLDGANLYSGATTISAGTLLVNGTHTGGGAYAVTGAGKFGGNGSISAASLSMAAGTKLTPGGDGVAGNAFNLSLAGGANLSAASNNTGAYLFDLGSTGASDKFTLTTGTLNLGTLDFLDFSFNTLAGFGGGTYTLFDAASAITVTLGATTGTVGGLNATLSYDTLNNDILLTVVPEPNALALGLGGFGLLGVCRRRRRRTA